jgi:hypothetical protein
MDDADPVNIQVRGGRRGLRVLQEKKIIRDKPGQISSKMDETVHGSFEKQVACMKEKNE